MREIVSEWVDITTIKLWDQNPRENDHAVADVAQSLLDFGFLVPIVVDKTGTVKAGNTRLKAAISLNMKRVPIIRAEHLSEKQITAFALADNKTHELAKWKLGDIPKLVALSELPSIPGFTKADIDKIGNLAAVKMAVDPAPALKQGGINTVITCPHCHQQFEGKAIKKNPEE